MIECGDLALGRLPDFKVGHGLQPSGKGLTSPALFLKLWRTMTSLCQPLGAVSLIDKPNGKPRPLGQGKV